MAQKVITKRVNGSAGRPRWQVFGRLSETFPFLLKLRGGKSPTLVFSTNYLNRWERPPRIEKHVPRRRLAHCASISEIGATTLRLLGIARVRDYVFPRVCRRPAANHRAHVYAARALSVCTNERHETMEDNELCVISQPVFGAKARVDRNENYKSTTNA
jgi:hypothetical protein